MRFLVFIVPVLLFFTQSGAQNHAIELKNIPLEIKNRRFYISRVIDSRADTTLLGWAILPKDTTPGYYTFKHGTSRSLSGYMDKNLPGDTSKVPLVMNIISLFVREKGKVLREGEAFAAVQFLKEKDGYLGKVFETKAYTVSNSEIARDIYSTHERRIRIVLGECLKNLNSSGWYEVKPDYVTELEIKQDAVMKDTLSKKIADSSGIYNTAKAEAVKTIELQSIQYKKGLVPVYMLNNKKYRQLWSFGTHFKQSGDIQTLKYYADYKGKFRLTACTFLIGAVLAAVSFSDDLKEENDGPNLGLLVPGAALALCSIPLHIRTNKLAVKTVERYNSVLTNK